MALYKEITFEEKPHNEDHLSQEEMALWCSKIHVEPPLIPIIKSKLDFKKENDYAKIKFRRSPTPEKLDMYEIKMDLFNNEIL